MTKFSRTKTLFFACISLLVFAGSVAHTTQNASAFNHEASVFQVETKEPDSENTTKLDQNADDQELELLDTEELQEEKSTVPNVPFYSQLTDIRDPDWKKIGCGIASLAMLVDYYGPAVDVNVLLDEGISAGAYLQDAGWTYAGLISVGEDHGVTGEIIVLHDLSMEDAYASLVESLKEGPVIASVYYTFTPGHPIPHLVVVNGIEDGVVYYNDPAEPDGGGTISVEKFKPAWKKRYITIRPL